MVKDSGSKAPLIIGIAIVAIVVCALIPYKAWDYTVFSDRDFVEGQVSAIDGNQIRVDINTSMGENYEPSPLGAYVVLEGDVPDYCRSGQSVIISIPSGSSLLQRVDKDVEVHFYKDTNVLMGLIVPMIAPVHVGAPSMTLKEINLNGTLLLYYTTGS